MIDAGQGGLAEYLATGCAEGPRIAATVAFLRAMWGGATLRLHLVRRVRDEHLKTAVLHQP